MFQPSKTTDWPLVEVTSHPTHMDMGNICDAPNSALYKNPEVSRQSACEIAGTSRFQASNKLLLKYCTKTFSNKRKKGSSVETKDKEKLQFLHIHH
jgi:hypothetical protein